MISLEFLSMVEQNWEKLLTTQNTNEWTIQPSFSVSCVSQGEIGASKYRTLGQASQALIDLWAAQAAYEASWSQYDDEYDAYQSWIDSVLSGFHLCGGSD